MTVKYTRRQLFEIFKNVGMLEIEVECLELRPQDGTSVMVKAGDNPPVFIAECELSQELLQGLMHYDLFNAMQFKSSIMNQQQQIVQFGTKLMRHIAFNLSNIDAIAGMNFGRLYFTVWWRWPYSSMQHLLGMGVLEMEDVFSSLKLQTSQTVSIVSQLAHVANLRVRVKLVSGENTSNEII